MISAWGSLPTDCRLDEQSQKPKRRKSRKTWAAKSRTSTPKSGTNVRPLSATLNLLDISVDERLDADVANRRHKDKVPIVEQGNYLKFTQSSASSSESRDRNPQRTLRELLLTTGERELVEVSYPSKALTYFNFLLGVG